MGLREELLQLGENTKKDARRYYKVAKQHPLTYLIYIIVVVIALLSLTILPHWQVSQFRINNTADKANYENQYRATLAQILGGIAIGIGLYYTWRRVTISENELKISQEGQITERFTRAIEQLGKKQLELKLGGIYALERISIESEKDYWPIMEIFLNYIRKNSPIEERNIKGENVKSQNEASSDIQAILTVIGRRKYSYNDGEYKRLDLQKICLQQADLREANLIGADLGEADLRRADLMKANLREANLGKADLREANLEMAYLENSNLREADLRRADLMKASLIKADLGKADLRGANLEMACLEMADFRLANLEEVSFKDAYLLGADLKWANMELADLYKAYIVGADLRGANLEMTYLREANLKGADFGGANLEEADLEEADIRKVNFIGANLKRANLKGADLGGTNLEKANLDQAKNLSFDQLSKVKTLYNAKLDENLITILKEKYPDLFEEPD